MNVRSPRTSFSATPTLPTGPFTACASRLEDQFSRVVARQNVQDDELAALTVDVAELQAKLHSMSVTNRPMSPPVPAVQAKIERARAAEIAAAKETGKNKALDGAHHRLAITGQSSFNGESATCPSSAAPDLNAGLYRLEARMDRQDTQIRALTVAVETLAAKVSEQNAQLAQIISIRPDSQIAALRTELASMNRWCERFNAAHDRTLARCASLEVKLVAANAEIARLREAAAKAHRKAEAGEHEVLEDEGGEGGEDEEKENTLVVPSTPVHRQLAAVRRESRESVKRNSGRGFKRAPSLPELTPNSPFSFSL